VPRTEHNKGMRERPRQDVTIGQKPLEIALNLATANVVGPRRDSARYRGSQAETIAPEF